MGNIYASQGMNDITYQAKSRSGTNSHTRFYIIHNQSNQSYIPIDKKNKKKLARLLVPNPM